MNVKTVLIILIVGLVVVMCLPKIEKYGQDASIRASAGWVAGRGMYGYDPIQRYAEQIEEMKRAKRIGKKFFKFEKREIIRKKNFLRI